jgi:hypothetical protein
MRWKNGCFLKLIKDIIYIIYIIINNMIDEKISEQELLSLTQKMMMENDEMKEMKENYSVNELESINCITMFYNYVVNYPIRHGIRDKTLALQFIYYIFGDKVKNDERFGKVYDDFFDIEIDDMQNYLKYYNTTDKAKVKDEDKYLVGSKAYNKIYDIFLSGNRKYGNYELSDTTKIKILSHISSQEMDIILDRARQMKKDDKTIKKLYIIISSNNEVIKGPFKTINECQKHIKPFNLEYSIKEI